MKPEIYKYFEEAIRIGASDLILKPGSPPTFRVNGHLIISEYESLASQQMYNLLLPVIDATQQENLQKNSKSSSVFVYSRTLTRIRYFIYKQRGAYAGTFRFIPNDVPSIKSLNLPDSLESLASVRKGLFLVTGPSGSGKTLTVSALVQSINERLARYIITIEKSIELVYRPIKSVFAQIEAGTEVSTYLEAVSNALREDADVIILGELKDKEIVEQALIAAETGHLVIATLPTSSSIRTIEQIINLFPNEKQDEIRNQLSQNLVGVLSQRLIPSTDYKLKPSLAYELLFATTNIRNIIRGSKYSLLASTILNEKENGCISFKESIEKLSSNEDIDKNYLNDLLMEVEG